MTTVTEVPLTPQPQTFGIVLASASYQMTIQWRGCWVLDVADVSGNAMVCGISLVTGADLLAQYPDLGFGGQLRVVTDHEADAIPTFDNLGVLSHLYFIED